MFISTEMLMCADRNRWGGKHYVSGNSKWWKYHQLFTFKKRQQVQMFVNDI